MHLLTRARTFGTFALLAMSGATFTACGDDSNDATGPQTLGAALAVAGDSQKTVVNTTTLTPLTVRAFGTSGGFVSGLAVTWTLVAGNGTLSAPSNVTDALGTASVTFKPTSLGLNTVRAVVAGAETRITFRITAVTAPPPE